MAVDVETWCYWLKRRGAGRLPPPIGMIVTALAPPVAIGAGIFAFVSYQRQHRALSALLAALSIVGVIVALAFVSVTSS